MIGISVVPLSDLFDGYEFTTLLISTPSRTYHQPGTRCDANLFLRFMVDLKGAEHDRIDREEKRRAEEEKAEIEELGKYGFVYNRPTTNELLNVMAAAKRELALQQAIPAQSVNSLAAVQQDLAGQHAQSRDPIKKTLETVLKDWITKGTKEDRIVKKHLYRLIDREFGESAYSDIQIGKEVKKQFNNVKVSKLNNEHCWVNVKFTDLANSILSKLTQLQPAN